MRQHPPRDPFARAHANALDDIGGEAMRDGDAQLVGSRIEEHQRATLCAEELHRFCEDVLEYGLKRGGLVLHAFHRSA